MVGEGQDVAARVERRVVLAAPPEVVWRALTEEGQLSVWLGDEVEIDACPGGQLSVRPRGQSRARRAVIVDFEPGSRLAFRWLPPYRPVGFVWAPDDTPPGVSGEVELTLEPLAAGRTRLTVVEMAPHHVGTRAQMRAGR